MMPVIPIGTIVLLIVVLALLTGSCAYRSASRCGRKARWAITACRVFAIFTLAIPLLNFGEWVAPPSTDEARWLVMLDRSASMQVEDTEAGSRWESALEAAEAVRQAAESTGVPVDFEPFDLTTGNAIDLAQLDGETPTGDGTQIYSAVEERLRRQPDTSLHGILLLTDGRSTVETPLAPVALLANAAQAPVHARVFGEPRAEPELELHLGRRQFTAFPGQNLQVSAQVHGESLPPTEAQVELINEAGERIAETGVRLPAGTSQREVRLEVPALPAGLHRFQMRLPQVAEGVKVEQNEGTIVVHVLEEPVRVLLVEGAPYWDTKFIAQLLQREEGFEFELIYRLSDDRFFRLEGLEETEESGQALQVFPDEAEALAEYDLVVFGKQVDAFLDPGRVRLLREWVEKRGGALLLARGKPVSSQMPELEPLFPMTWDQTWHQSYHWRPTFAGVDSGLFGGMLPGRDSSTWRRLPALDEAVYGRELAPFTRVLVEGVSEAGGTGERTFPAVVSRRIGDGYVVSIQSGDLWRWDFIPQVEEARTIYRDFWLQLFHWAVAYSDFLPGKEVALRVNRSTVLPGEPLKARVLQRGAAARSGQTPVLSVTGPGEEQTLALSAVPGRQQAWESVFSLDQPGDYLFRLAPDGEAENEEAQVFAQVEVEPLPAEQDDLNPDQEAMARLAKATNGRILQDANQLEALVRESAAAPAPGAGDARWESRWDQPWVLLVMLAFFTSEWIIRRREGFV